MRIGTSTNSLVHKYGEEVAIIKYAEAGFDALDFGFFHYPIRGEGQLFTGSEEKFKEYFTKLGDTANKAGIKINQVHSPMPSYTGKPDEDEYLFAIQEKSIKAASYMGSPYIIIHPCIPSQYRYTHFKNECKDINMDFYTRLKPTLRKYNVKLAIENMFNYDPVLKCNCPTVCSTPEEILDYIDTLNDDHFVACLDIGHANLTGSTPEYMINILGDKLETLHVHDNNGLSDQHILSYLGNIDWDGVYKALTKINYQGVFSFECDGFFTSFGDGMIDDTLKFMYKMGKVITHTEV
jgi:sugar phosphate isomerase/epimerase